MIISVITPLYYGKKYIQNLLKMMAENAVHLAAGQCELEFVLVNDSPGEPVSQNALMKDTISGIGNLSVHLLQNEQNAGIHLSRVRGLEIASGEYVMFLDQDDRLEPDCLKELLTGMIKKGELADIVVGNGTRITPRGKLTIYKSGAAMRLACREKMFLYGTDMILSPGQCLIRKESIPQRWRENILYENGCDDLYLWLVMLEQGCRVWPVHKKIYYHVETVQNYSASSNAMTKSFEQMCVLLEHVGYPAKKVRILRRRYAMKNRIKAAGSVWQKFKAVVFNPDIAAALLLYKLSGYH